MSDETERQAIVDEEHLKLLSLGYMVSGGFAALFSLFGALYGFIGLFVGLLLSRVAEPASKAGEQPPAFVGWVLGAIGAAFFVAMLAVAAARFWTALCLRRRKSRTFCMVVAAINCLEFPYGTLLGVLTFLVLGRDSVARTFTPARKGASAPLAT